jgi:hypothetical protein
MDTDYRLFVPLDLFKTPHDIEHACIITIMADIITRTLSFPLTISDWYTTKKSGIRVETRVETQGDKVLIIEGIRDDFNSLRRPIRRYLVSMPLILITERRNPGHSHYGREIEKQLSGR